MFAPDVFVLTWLSRHHAGWATKLSETLMAASTNAPLLAFAAVMAGLYVLALRRWATAIAVVSATVITVILADGLKMLIGRPRPTGSLALVEGLGFSMPSTDGALTMAAAVALFLTTTWSTRRARQVFGGGLAALVVAIGLSMVYLGAHWPTDVLAGWVLGGLVAWGFHAAQQRILGRAAGSAIH